MGKWKLTCTLEKLKLNPQIPTQKTFFSPLHLGGWWSTGCPLKFFTLLLIWSNFRNTLSKEWIYITTKFGPMERETRQRLFLSVQYRLKSTLSYLLALSWISTLENSDESIELDPYPKMVHSAATIQRTTMPMLSMTFPYILTTNS